MTTTRPVRVYTMRQYPGNSKWVRELVYERATFHRFGTDYNEYEAGPGLYPCAIVELSDGTVITPSASMIQFLDRPGVEVEHPSEVRNPALLN
jgi:hypothetical protein